MTTQRDTTTDMDCETCNDLLLDLAYGELDEVRAAAVRKHADSCAECVQAMRRITRGRSLARQLPMEEAPAISDALRAAIQGGVGARVSVPGGGSLDVETQSSGGDVIPISRGARGPAGWLERVGELAMRRQVAMAAVFLFMIGVGLVFYQTHPRPIDAPDDRSPDVVPAVEVTGGVGSAQPTAAAPVNVRPRGVAPGFARQQGMELRDDRNARAPAVVAQPSAMPTAPPSISAALQANNQPGFDNAVPPRMSERSQRQSGVDSLAQPSWGSPAAVAQREEAPAPSPAAAAPAPPPAQYAQNMAAVEPQQQVPSAEGMRATVGSSGSTAHVRASNGSSATGSSDDSYFAGAAQNNVQRDQPGREQQQQQAPSRVAQLRTALAQASDDVSRARIALDLADALMQTGRSDEARSVLQSVHGTAEQTARAHQQIAALNGNAQNANAAAATATSAEADATRSNVVAAQASPPAAARPTQAPAAASNVAVTPSVAPATTPISGGSNSMGRASPARRTRAAAPSSNRGGSAFDSAGY